MSRVVRVLPFRRDALLHGQLPRVDGVSAAAAASHVSRVSRGAVRHHLRREVHNHACKSGLFQLLRTIRDGVVVVVGGGGGGDDGCFIDVLLSFCYVGVCGCCVVALLFRNVVYV